MEKVYVALDVEAAGPNPYGHAVLSVGAAVVTRETLPSEDSWHKDLVFYAEIKPHTLNYSTDAMRVGCLHLKCLEENRGDDPRYDPTREEFDCLLVLKHMRKVCENPTTAMRRFRKWLEYASSTKEIVGVVDTVFFDSVFINMFFGRYSGTLSPFGYKGLDLTSLYQGHTGRKDAKLSKLGVPDNREKPHRADHDAVLLAETARVLLFDKMGWE
jgi:hypothetical protein